MPPFARFPLEIRFFNKIALDHFNAAKDLVTLPGFEPSSIPPLPQTGVVLDLGGVLGSEDGRSPDIKGVTALDGPIDVKDTEFCEALKVKAQLQNKQQAICHICNDKIAPDVSSSLLELGTVELMTGTTRACCLYITDRLLRDLSLAVSGPFETINFDVSREIRLSCL